MRILRLRKINYSTSVKAANNYTKTVILPQTKFPLRLDGQKLIDRDKYVAAINNKLYKWQRNRDVKNEFVLHDGPPYANGTPHMGHAINKILKDVIVRTKMLEGKKVHYTPGWDCHGLPIELKAITNAKANMSDLDIRQKARNFATQTIEKQKEAFRSWGVLGDWDNPYTTYSKEYMKNQMWKFYELYEKKLVFRDVKPVYWSPSSRTALAEAELEYNPKHKSTSVTVRFEAKNVNNDLKTHSRLYFLIWTTTPWTLPSNQAVCYNKSLKYCTIRETGTKDDVYILATNLVPALSQSTQKQYDILQEFAGASLHECSYIHPIYGSEHLLLDSDHATDSKGTGLVHTAPAHGQDDFLVSLKHNISIKCIVDEFGKYTTESGPHLQGLEVLSEGTKKVLELIKPNIINTELFTHSYPYDWRTKKPVILIAQKQWFIDTDAIKDKAVEATEAVEIIPKFNSDMHRKNLVGQLKKRPYWCISRQRKWGSPIPVFYGCSGEVIVNREIIQNLCDLLDKHGPDYWWTLPLTDLLPKQLNVNTESIKKSEDILDIWFDSGISWSNALPEPQIADMYLEGLDQFTGWFQSSLTTSVALRGKAPYKTLYVHGFALDENGQKMSKSVGNVINPQEIMYGKKGQKGYGIDTLRWWVACHANQDVMAHISKNVLQASADEVQKIRNVLRFALGGLFDYEGIDVNYPQLPLIDRYLLHVLYKYRAQVVDELNNYRFHKLCITTINIITNQVSALYYTAIKDRLYCEPVNSYERKTAQYVLFQIYSTISKSVAPIIPHLVEELHDNLRLKEHESFFQTETLEPPEFWLNDDVETKMNLILDIRRDINKLCGKSACEQAVEITLKDDVFNKRELVDILQVSQINLKNNTEQVEAYKITAQKSQLHHCDRCRKYCAENINQICRRCSEIIERN